MFMLICQYSPLLACYNRLMIETTLIYLRKDNKILLGKKLRGFGMGKMTGVGGKFEKGETAKECAIRETFEESGVRVTNITEAGRIVYDNLVWKGSTERCFMYVFVATEWEGEPQSSEEMELEWFALRDIPYEKMWSDAQVYLPALLRGEHFEAYFLYNEKNEYTDHWLRPICDDILAEPEDKDFGFEDNGFNPETAWTRLGARAVLLDEKGRVCLSHGKNRGYFKLPGGGRNASELFYETLEREVQEEVGYKIKNAESLGRVVEHRAKQNKNVDCQGFICYTDGFVGTKLEEDELEDGMEAYWADDIDDALRILENMSAKTVSESLHYQINFWKTREMAFLRKAKQLLSARLNNNVVANNESDEDFGNERDGE